ncbi:MAG: lytic murein transglycosylase [Gemmatimonadales bacterium]
MSRPPHVAGHPPSRSEFGRRCSSWRGAAWLGAGIAIAAGATRAAAQEPGAFGACLQGLRAEAVKLGVAGTAFDTAVAGLEPDTTVITARANQPEFRLAIWDYFAALVDSERIADGTARLAEWRDTFAAVEKQYRIDRHVLAAIWGVESDYGKALGSRPVLRSLATGACQGTRRRFFRGEFLAAVRIVSRGDIRADSLRGSWAGAFGHTQFMPSTFQSRAVDGDGDGRRDIVGSIPDALASAANYLRVGGWRPDEPWGYEVRLPARFRLATGRRQKLAVTRWQAAGVRQIDGTRLTGTGSAAVLLPAGRSGPAFLVFRNFDVLYSYNAAESYALAIGHLADRLRGGEPFVTPWPTEDGGLSRAERREVQRLLGDLGFDAGAPDGIMGRKTREAVAAFQATAGLDPTGRAGTVVLDSLRTRSARPR